VVRGINSGVHEWNGGHLVKSPCMETGTVGSDPLSSFSREILQNHLYPPVDIRSASIEILDAGKVDLSCDFLFISQKELYFIRQRSVNSSMKPSAVSDTAASRVES
jgi:hypothetical protein